MQFSKIAFAVAALAATSAFAAPDASRIALSAGASAVQNNLKLALVSLCTAPNVATSFVTGNFTTVVCADATVVGGAGNSYVTKTNTGFKNFDGLPFAEVRVNVSDGSFGSVLINNGKVYTFQDPATLTQIAAPAGAVIIGGFADVQTDAFPSSVIGTNVLGNNTGAGVAQTFGVAASNPLYTKMFDAQKTAGLIPASCNVNDTTVGYCIPSIAKAQMATIMTDNPFNAAYLKGLGFLTNDVADEGVELRYVRRVDTSGTQASAQNYFLGLPCSKSGLPVVAEPTTDDEVGGNKDALINAIRVYATGGTGNVRDELNKAGVYALGVMSGENNKTLQSYRWLRVDGAAIGENAEHGVSTTTNSNTMKNGSYSFFFELTYSGGNATNDGYLGTIAGALNTLPAPVGLVNAAGLSGGYTKGGQTCQGSASN
jgi:hypothetical protein